jgi:hypothetical protein
MGKLAPHAIVAVIDSEGKELPDGEEGELAVRVDVGAGSRWIFKGEFSPLSGRQSFPLTSLLSIHRIRQEGQD